MERNDPGQGFRARAMQLLSWLTGIREQERQQQTQQADRQQWDGYTRGMDDPDTRRMPPAPPHPDPVAGGSHRVDRRGETATTADAVQRQSQQGAGQEQRLLDPAELTAIRARLQAHHRALQPQQRGQGRGY